MSDQANVFSSMTSMFGSGFFDMSQDGVCECVDVSETKERYVSFLQEISSNTSRRKANALVEKARKSPESWGIGVEKVQREHVISDIKDEL